MSGHITANNPVIPDQLNITILTSIPGLQMIAYSSEMTLKDVKGSKVRFDPRYKLTRAIMEKIPETYRIKQFFNAGLFQSLKNFIGRPTAGGLIQATRLGLIDNNIQVTLDTIFPIGSLLYIGGKSYIIADVRWSRGDWSVGVKYQKPVLNLDEFQSPLLKAQLVNAEIVEGIYQLNQLPNEVREGDHYTGEKEITAESPPSTDASVSSRDAVPQPLADNTIIQPPTLAQDRTPAPPTVPLLTDAEDAEEPSRELVLPESPNETSIEVSSPVPPPVPPPIQEDDDFLRSSIANTNRRVLNEKKAKLLQKFFQKEDYYQMTMKLLDKFDQKTGQYILSIYTEGLTKTFSATSFSQKPVSWTKKIYNQLCNQLVIYDYYDTETGMPSSFANPNQNMFIAIADCITDYNSENSKGIISYANYGINDAFTGKTLREIAWNEFSRLPLRPDKAQYYELASLEANRLNALFSKMRTSGEVDAKNYREKIRALYMNSPNFMVKYESSVPTLTPFSAVDISEAEEYFMNVYEGDEFALNAWVHTLQLCVVIIYKTKYGYQASVPSASLNPANKTTRVVFVLYDHETNAYNVLYYQHWVSFRVLFDRDETEPEYYEKRLVDRAIYSNPFDLTNGRIPPMPLLILLFGSNYLALETSQRKTYSIFTNVMNALENSYSLVNFLPEFREAFKSVFRKTAKKRLPKMTVKRRTDGREKRRTHKNAQVQPTTAPAPVAESSSTIAISKRAQGTVDVKRGGQPLTSTANPAPVQAIAVPAPVSVPVETSRLFDTEPSKIAYKITVEMQLILSKDGEKVSQEDIAKMKCSAKYNAIRKAYAEFRGHPYIIPPVYE